MKKIGIALIVALVLLASCSEGVPEQVSYDYPFVLTVSGAGALNQANLVVKDSDGITHTLTGASLPVTYSYTYSSGNEVYIWAQNATTSFSDDLTLMVTMNGVPITTQSTHGLYCSVGYQKTLPYGSN